MSVLRWERPTEHGNAKVDYDAITAELKQRPGEWALVAENVHTSTAYLAFGRRGVEVKARGTRAGQPAAQIFARWPEAVSS